MSDIINDVAVKVRNGEGLTNEEARQLLEAYAALDIVIQAQGNLANLILQAVPDLVFAVAGSVKQRCGRTEEKVRRSVQKITEEHLTKFYTMIAEIVHGANEEANVPESGNPDAQSEVKENL